MNKQTSFIDSLLTYVISILLCVGVFYLLFTALKYNHIQQLNIQAESGLNKVVHVRRSVLDSLSSLSSAESLKQEHCSEQTLTAMRKQLFLSDYVKDFGFFQDNKLVCTTGLGLLDTPIAQTKYDYVGPQGEIVWLNLKIALFNQGLGAIVVQQDNFNAVILRKVLDDLFSFDAHWELVYADNNIIHIAGQNDVATSLENNEYLYRFSQCIDASPYCVYVGTTFDQFYTKYKLTLIACGLISAFICLFLVIVFKNFFKKYRSVDARITRGLKNNAFFCLYQPIVDLASQRIIGCEVLARYQDNEGDIYPDTFIPIISQQGQTWEFTLALLDKVQHDIASHLDVDPKFKININFFAQDITSGKALALTDKNVIDTSLCQFVVEITEDEQLSKQSSANTLKTLSDYGFQIAIDDFGTGYSNLNQIKVFNCHSLKIDRSFINEMEGGAIRATLIPHIVDIANKIGTSVVAEGIENSMQYEALKEVGVEFGQGWMFGKPMPIEQLNTLINNNNKKY